MTALPRLAVLMAVPGLAATLVLVRPGELRVSGRLALVFGLGYAAPGLVAFALALLGVLRPLPFFAALAALTVGLVAAAVRARSASAHLASVREELRTDRWPLVVGAAVIVAIAIVRADYLSGPSTLRYWVDAVEIADAHEVPAQTLMYGASYPTVTSKVFLNAFNAAASFLTGADPLASMHALLFLGSLGLALALWGLGRELGLRLTAPLLPLLTLVNTTILNTELTSDLRAYRAETFGRLAGVCALLVAVAAVSEPGRRRLIALAGVLLAAAGGTHLVSAAVTGAVLAWYAVARLRSQGGRRSLLRGGAVVLVGAALTGVLLGSARQDLGLQGVGRGDGYRPLLGRYDPTYYLHAGKFLPLPASRTWLVPPGQILEAYMAQTFVPGFEFPKSPSTRPFFPRAPAFAVAAVTLIVAAGALRWLPHDLAPLPATGWGVGLTLVAGALLFAARFDVWIPAVFGIRRLFDYSGLAFLLFTLPLVEAALGLTARIRPRAPVAVATALVLGATLLLAPANRAAEHRVRSEQHVVRLANWIRAHVPCDARILASKRTSGVFRGLTGRVAVLEGMAPYLRPGMLDAVNDKLRSARAFFRDPARNRGFLVSEQVTWVVVLTKVGGYTAPVGKVRARTLREVPFLRVSHQGRSFTAFEVVDLPTPDPPDLLPAPGYTCRRVPLPSR